MATGKYYVEAADWLRAVGLTVVESDDWQTRARSSGGFANPPLGCQWHHTASKTSPENDIAWQTEGSDDAPIGNATIMRDGSIWMVAAGGANTAGKGGPLRMSRGEVPLNSGNSTTWAWEVANDGVGEPWSEATINSYFLASNTMNRHFGNLPTDVFTHAIGKSSCRGWTDRKVDPARADAVQGPWRPRSVNSSGTWDLEDIRAECARRAGDDEEEEDMALSDEDIERIARAVWREKIDVSGHPDANIASVVGWTYGDVQKIKNATDD